MVTQEIIKEFEEIEYILEVATNLIARKLNKQGVNFDVKLSVHQAKWTIPVLQAAALKGERHNYDGSAWVTLNKQVTSKKKDGGNGNAVITVFLPD